MTATVPARNDTRDVNLSQYHAGQIVSPVLTEQMIRPYGGTHILLVRWHWVDTSVARGQSGREYGHGECRGTVATCAKAVRAAGIRTDDSRSYI